MTRPVAIRDAVEADVEAIARVQVQAWRESYAGLLRPDVLAGLSVKDRARLWRSMLARPQAKLTVAEAEGGIVGVGAPGPGGAGALGTEAEILSIYLLDGFKRRAVGRRLMAALFAHLRDARFASVGLWVFADNRSARGFYEALGAEAGEGQKIDIAGQVLVEIAYRFRPIPNLSSHVTSSTHPRIR